MTGALIAARVAVSVTIIICVGLAFLPHCAARRLTRLQKFLSEMIERRRA